MDRMTKQVPDELYHTEQINSYIPKDEMVLIFGDKSPVIYLYYLNRKGVVINKLNQNRLIDIKKASLIIL